MARKKSEPAQPKKLSIDEQVEWIRAHKDTNLYVSEPARTTILQIFTMLDDTPMTLSSDSGSLVTCAGAYKLFLQQDNLSLFTHLSQQAATVL